MAIIHTNEYEYNIEKYEKIENIYWYSCRVVRNTRTRVSRKMTFFPSTILQGYGGDLHADTSPNQSNVVKCRTQITKTRQDNGKGKAGHSCPTLFAISTIAVFVPGERVHGTATALALSAQQHNSRNARNEGEDDDTHIDLRCRPLIGKIKY